MARKTKTWAVVFFRNNTVYWDKKVDAFHDRSEAEAVLLERRGTETGLSRYEHIMLPLQNSGKALCFPLSVQGDLKIIDGRPGEDILSQTVKV
jgi:hypothetical protein